MAYAIIDKEDPELRALLTENFKKIVFNDKDKSGMEQLKFFVPYLNNMTEDFFTKEIFPHIDFVMKRTGTLIPAIT